MPVMATNIRELAEAFPTKRRSAAFLADQVAEGTKLFLKWGGSNYKRALGHAVFGGGNGPAGLYTLHFHTADDPHAFEPQSYARGKTDHLGIWYIGQSEDLYERLSNLPSVVMRRKPDPLHVWQAHLFAEELVLHPRNNLCVVVYPLKPNDVRGAAYPLARSVENEWLRLYARAYGAMPRWNNAY